MKPQRVRIMNGECPYLFLAHHFPRCNAVLVAAALCKTYLNYDVNIMLCAGIGEVDACEGYSLAKLHRFSVLFCGQVIQAVVC